MVEPRFRVGPYEFGTIEADSEIEQVHRLNYRTFVEEIPQHFAEPGEALVDKFHSKNRYFGAFRKAALVGMTAVHSEPPYSIADRLLDASVLDRLGGNLLEVRLLAVEPYERRGLVFAGLGWQVHRYAVTHGYSCLLISGLEERRLFYQRLGFRPIGQAFGESKARFIPMALNLSSLPSWILRDIDIWETWIKRSGTSLE